MYRALFVVLDGLCHAAEGFWMYSRIFAGGICGGGSVVLSASDYTLPSGRCLRPLKRRRLGSKNLLIYSIIYSTIMMGGEELSKWEKLL